MYRPVPLHTDPVTSYINRYRPILTQYHQVPTCITLYNASSCNAQLSQLEDFSFCDSFDESRSVFGPVFSYFSLSVFFLLHQKKDIFLIHFSSPPQKSFSPSIAQDHNIDKRFALFTLSSCSLFPSPLSFPSFQTKHLPCKQILIFSLPFFIPPIQYELR